MSDFECRGCGLAACDLPDGVDPSLVFEDGLCQGCQLGSNGTWSTTWIDDTDPLLMADRRE